MTKKLKILLISVLFLVATVCVCAFAGCKVKYTVDELKEKYGLTAQITYFLNGTGGNFDDESYVKHLYYKPGDMPMDIGSSRLVSGSSALNVSDGFNFTGWYKVEVDSAGKPLYANGTDTYNDGDAYDVKKRMLMSKDPFDFTKPLKDGDNIYLCGDFYEDIKLKVNLLCMPTVDGSEFNKIEYKEGTKTVTVENEKEIEYGSRLIPKVGELGPNSNAIQNKFSGYTVEGFYQKVEGTEDQYVPFDGWPVKYPEPDSEGKYHDIVIYAKMLKGEWDIVSTPAEVGTMFSLGSHNYYIKQDIDGDGREIRNIRRLTGIIWGGEEGHTLKNFKVVNNSLTTTDRASIFGQVQNSAVIKNITLENFTVNFTVADSGRTEDPDINFVANSIAAGATIENVSVSGTLNITLSTDKCLATNTTANNWLFGDKDDATYDKIKVPYATCTIVDGDGNDVTYTVGNKDNNQTEDL